MEDVPLAEPAWVVEQCGPRPSIITIRAPTGELAWTMIELQGSIECKAGATLDGQKLGDFQMQGQDVRPLPFPRVIRVPCPDPRRPPDQCVRASIPLLT